MILLFCLKCHQIKKLYNASKLLFNVLSLPNFYNFHFSSSVFQSKNLSLPLILESYNVLALRSCNWYYLQPIEGWLRFEWVFSYKSKDKCVFNYLYKIKETRKEHIFDIWKCLETNNTQKFKPKHLFIKMPPQNSQFTKWNIFQPFIKRYSNINHD